MDNSIDGMAILDRNGVYTYVNKAHAKTHGYDAPKELLGKSWETLYDEEQLRWFAQHLEPALARDGYWQGEATGKRRDGGRFPQEISIATIEGGERVCLVRDTTQRKALEGQLKRQAFHDSLTNLPNRALFMDRLEHALARCYRSNNSIAVLFMDLDNFKVINDSLGHELGDQLLIAVSSRLQETTRPGDTLARLGGDEFTILLEDITDISDAVQVAERITTVLQAPFTVDGHEVFVTTSIGIALSTAGLHKPSDLVREADIAMYKAKAEGRASYEVFNPSMYARALRHLELQSALHRAIEREELRVYYQPKVDLANETPVGMEALVRWEHPERGLLSPQEFITLAEETGLIVQIGRWVLEEACEKARKWQEQYANNHLTMSVNLSIKQLQQPQLVEEVAQVLQATRLDPTTLVLEITESALIEDMPSTIATLQRLKSLGIQLAIDDFGIGYSSLSSLKHFPVDMLKIDKSFIQGLRSDADDEVAIVSGVRDLAHNLGLKIVAEGIETAEQLSQLRALRCELGQGYYFAKPLRSDEAEDVLSSCQHSIVYEAGGSAILFPVATEGYYTTAEAARILKVTDARVRQMLLAGELEGERDDSGRWRIPAHSVHERTRRPARVERERLPEEATDVAGRLRELQERVEALQYQLGRSQARAELTEHADSILRETLERERQRAEQESQRAEQERLRANRLEEEAENLRRQLEEARLAWWGKLFR